MADLYGFFSRAEDYPAVNLEAHLDLFNHYYSSEKTAFYRLPEAHFITTFFYQV